MRQTVTTDCIHPHSCWHSFAAVRCRARRHADAVATPAGPICPHCGRICESQSYPYLSTTAQLTLHQRNVIVKIDSDYHKQYTTLMLSSSSFHTIAIHILTY